MAAPTARGLTPTQLYRELTVARAEVVKRSVEHRDIAVEHVASIRDKNVCERGSSIERPRVN